MILRFSSGSDTPASAVQEPLRASTTTSDDPGGGHEVLLDLLGLALAQQPVVDEHAGQLVADRPLHERGGHRRVHAAGQRAEHPRVDRPARGSARPASSTTLVGGPVGLEAGAVAEEVLQHPLPELGVHHLGVPLHAVQPALVVLERRDRRAGRGRGHRETVRRAGHGVAVRHPDRLLGWAGRRTASRRCPRRTARYARTRRSRCGPRAAERLRHRLEAVAHAEDRDPGRSSAASRAGAPSAYTEDGPPERITAAGLRSRISETDKVCGTTSL